MTRHGNLTLYLDSELQVRKNRLPKSRTRSIKNKPCIFCGTFERMSSHHLIPVAYRKKTGLHPKNNKQVALCRKHHTILHILFSNQELAEIHNTKEKIVERLRREQQNHFVLFGKYPEWACFKNTPDIFDVSDMD